MFENKTYKRYIGRHLGNYEYGLFVKILGNRIIFK